MQELNYTFPDGRTADGWVEVIIMLSQLLDVVVVEAGVELGKIISEDRQIINRLSGIVLQIG